MVKYLLISCMLLGIYLNAGAVKRNVPQQYPTIQSAINAAANGDTILVASGTYVENISFLGKGIVVASNFLLARDTSYIRTTIIDGSSPVYPDTASCVRITSKNPLTYADSTAVLMGFTIRNGTGTRWQDEHNPGSWYREGAGLLIQYLSPRICFNHFINNKAISNVNCTSAGGGAIRCGDGDPLITNNIIDHNQGLYGGGLVFNYSGATIRNNIISNNSGGQDFGGGGIWLYGQEAHGKPRIVENNTIVNNASVLSGGGMRVWSTPVTVINNILWGNTSSIGSQIYSTTGSAVVTYSDVQFGYAGKGNMDLSPQFDNSDYFLTSASPCIDKGDSSLIYQDPPNTANPSEAQFPAMGALRNDMGAYGGKGSALLGNLDATATGTGENGTPGCYRQAVMISPNPCTDHILVTFNAGSDQAARIEILNTLGTISFSRQISLSADGTNKADLDVSRLNPGTYILRIIANIQIPNSTFIKL